jgi:hypothetical protein
MTTRAGESIRDALADTSRRLAAVLILLLFSTNVYRAWTQSITADEAFSFNLFLAGGPSHIFSSYDAANHVLHTIFCEASISLFGPSEFTLRLPSLLGGLFYLITAFRLCRYIFGGGWFFLLSFASIALNPFVLDYLSVARGYGLALAFFLWALYHAIRCLAERDPAAPELESRRLRRIAIGLSLSVGSNLAMAFPCAAVAVLLALALAADALGASGRAALSLQAGRFADHFAVPGAVIAFLILVLPLSHAEMSKYYYGAPDLATALESIVNSSLFYDHNTRLPLAQVYGEVLWFARRFVPLVMGAAGVALVFIGARWLRARALGKLSRLDQFLFWCGGTMLLTLAALVFANKVFGVLYPLGRTGVYWVPLFSLACFAFVRKLVRPAPVFRVLVSACLAGATVVLVQYALLFNTGYYEEWRYDASTKRLVEVIRARHAGEKEKIRIGADWEFEASLNFYRQIYSLNFIEPLDRTSPDGDYDFYVLLPRSAPLLKKRRLEVLYADPVAGVTLAAPQERPPRE